MSQRSSPAVSLRPVPVAVVSFRMSDGGVRLLPVGWFGVVCSRPNILSVAFRSAGTDLAGLGPGGAFVVNLLSEVQLAAQLDHGPLPPSAVAAWDGSLPAEIPVLAGALLQIECRLRSLSGRFEQTVLSGEVVALHWPEEAGSPEPGVDLCRCDPFARHHRSGILTSGCAGEKIKLP